MMNFSGTGRVDYEDVLRAVGYFVDQNNIKEVCIIELKEGLLIRGVRYTTDRQAGYQTISETFLFTHEDLELLLEDAYKRRQPKKSGIFRLRPNEEG